MEKKNRILVALAIGAVALLVASGIARCAMTSAADSGGGGNEAGKTAEVRQQEAGDSDPLSEVENTTWKSEDDRSTLTVLPGVLIESTEAGETLYYYEASGVQRSGTGMTATLSLSKSRGGETTDAALSITKGTGSMHLACDSLSTDYAMETGDAGIALVGVDENLTTLFGKQTDEFSAAIEKWASSRSPYATKATWSKEVWIDYAASSFVTTFALDDAASSIVSVTMHGAGELMAS